MSKMAMDWEAQLKSDRNRTLKEYCETFIAKVKKKALKAIYDKHSKALVGAMTEILSVDALAAFAEYHKTLKAFSDAYNRVYDTVYNTDNLTQKKYFALDYVNRTSAEQPFDELFIEFTMCHGFKDSKDKPLDDKRKKYNELYDAFVREKLECETNYDIILRDIRSNRSGERIQKNLKELGFDTTWIDEQMAEYDKAYADAKDVPKKPRVDRSKLFPCGENK